MVSSVFSEGSAFHRRNNQKNPRTDAFIDPGISQFYPPDQSAAPDLGGTCPSPALAGLLTPGSSSSRAFPAGKQTSGISAGFVPVTADGPVSDSHGVPFQTRLRAPDGCLLHTKKKNGGQVIVSLARWPPHETTRADCPERSSPVWAPMKNFSRHRAGPSCYG